MEAPVLLIFFNRPKVLEESFGWIRRVKPARLFLAQDGPRESCPEDMGKILACRRVVEDIDWECEVHKNYSEKNLSCDEREFTAISWCFEFVDRLIVLEDDCRPSDSFYPFCGELLERYRENQRIQLISGFNRCNIYDGYPYDYVFSTASAGIGWATWRRVWEEVQKLQERKEWDSGFLDLYGKIIDSNSMKILRGTVGQIPERKRLDVQEGKVHAWEFWVGLDMLLQDRLSVTPARNMVKYLGVAEGATHSANCPELMIGRVRRVLLQSAYETEGPLKHPPLIVRDRVFEQRDYEAFWRERPFLERMESLLLKLRYKRGELVRQSLGRWFRKGKRG
nr:hypothetical protein [uncultured Acetatifactor sp.]